MAKQGFSVGRDISVTVTGSLPIDGYKSLLEKVQQFEDRISGGETIANITAQKVVGTSKTQYAIYVFDVTADFAAGTYTFAFVETAPNVEEAASI